MNIEQIIKDFLLNKISYEEFIKHFDEMEGFLEPRFKYAVDNPKVFPPDYTYWKNTLRLKFEDILKTVDVFHRKTLMYSFIYMMMVRSNYWDLPYDNIYYKQGCFLFDYVPSFLNSEEASVLFENYLFPCLPKNVSKEEMKKFVEDKCYEIFDLKDLTNIPQWIKLSDWPVRHGKACKFISTEVINRARSKYTFQDVTNNEVIVIEQVNYGPVFDEEFTTALEKSINKDNQSSNE